jgi:hypothetical protein
MYDEEDRGLEFIANCFKGGIAPTLVDYAKSDQKQKQTYYVEWETMQSFETGFLFLLGAMRSSKNNLFQKLSPEIMNTLSFHKLWTRSNYADVFEYIQSLHDNITDDDIKEMKRLVYESISTDVQGLIFQVSPFLSILNALMNIHTDRLSNKIIFVLKEHMCRNAMDAPFKALLPFFDKNDDSLVYIDTTALTFCDYIEENVKPEDLNNSVIVTYDPWLLENSSKKGIYENITFISPECKIRHINEDYFNTLSLKKPMNEYILYKQKPVVLKK